MGTSSYIAYSTRAAIYLRDAAICSINMPSRRLRCLACDHEMSVKDAQLDHREPRSTGGSNRPHNLRTLCPNCNASKGEMGREWEATLDTIFAERLERAAHLPLASRADVLAFIELNKPGWLEKQKRRNNTKRLKRFNAAFNRETTRRTNND